MVGYQKFFGLDFIVTPDVLIPRSDSEVLVEAALKARPGARRVLDCGTGSGALLLAVLHDLPQAEGVGIDRSEPALAVAADNAARLGLDVVDYDNAGEIRFAGTSPPRSTVRVYVDDVFVGDALKDSVFDILERELARLRSTAVS